MPEPRYELIDGQLLSRLMRCPDTTGVRHTVRSLAAASGLSKSKISDMLHDRRPLVTRHQSDAIAEAVGVPHKALFRAHDVRVRGHEQEAQSDPRRKEAARTARSRNELGEHPRPHRADRGRLTSR